MLYFYQKNRMSTSSQFPIDKFTTKNISILHDLPPSVRKSIEAKMVYKQFSKGQAIFLEGSYPAGIFYLKAGLVKKYKTDHTGREHIHQICTDGDLLGYSAVLAQETYPDSASTLEASNIGFIPKESFMEILGQSESLMFNLLSNLSHEFGVLVNSVNVFAHMSVRERLALTLLILTEKFPTNPNTQLTEIKLSRIDLANMVGTTVETLVRLLQELRKEGIVEIKGKVIILIKIKELVQMSKFY